MRVGLFAVGRLKADPEKDLAARYIDRFAKAGPAIGLELGKMAEVGESRAGNAETRKREEAAALDTMLDGGAVLVLLDERGKAMSSEAFAALLGKWRDEGVRETRFLIGAADGHSDAERAAADLLLAFGPATWPHLMARAMLMEQLFRATGILAGHPYHRAG